MISAFSIASEPSPAPVSTAVRCERPTRTSASPSAVKSATASANELSAKPSAMANVAGAINVASPIPRSTESHGGERRVVAADHEVELAVAVEIAGGEGVVVRGG